MFNLRFCNPLDRYNMSSLLISEYRQAEDIRQGYSFYIHMKMSLYRRFNDQYVDIKTITILSDTKLYERGLSILTHIDHPNIIKTYGYKCQADDQSHHFSIDVIFERTGMNLSEYLLQKYISMQDKIHILASIADGLIYLADHNITKFELRVGRKIYPKCYH